MSEAIEAYPLSWPVGRARARSRATSNFRVTIGDARDEIVNEVKLLGGRKLILSSNLILRSDGLPYATQRRVDDPGVAVYFERNAKRMCFACDRWNRVADNMRAIAKTIDALRGIARWGTGDMLEAAFTGFMALPAPIAAGMARPWREVLLMVDSRHATDPNQIREAYRRLAMQAHPDRGGSTEKMAELNRARDEALQEIGT